MKLLAALKELRVIEKRMTRNSENIQAYASQLSTERPIFGTEEEQRKQVASLVQANSDLTTEYLGLKRRIEQTNLQTKVTIQGKEYSLNDLLILKRGLGKKVMSTYLALNEENGNNKLRLTPRTSGEKTVRVERFYDERERNEGLRRWQDLLDEADAKLEIYNATVELAE